MADSEHTCVQRLWLILRNGVTVEHPPKLTLEMNYSKYGCIQLLSMTTTE